MRLLDQWLLHASGRYLTPDIFSTSLQGAFVDVGFGEEPVTTLETAELLRRACEAQGGGPLHVVGVETEPFRVERAQEFADESTEFLLVEFALTHHLDRPARLIRAMNVLRQYAPEEVATAHGIWGEALEDGGYLIEGTCDGDGAVLTAHVLQRADGVLKHLGILFATDFSRGFSPWLFRDRLPADLRRSLRRGHPARSFLAAWDDDAQAARAAGATEPGDTFRVAGASFAEANDEVICDEVMATTGHLFWRCDLPLPG